jgi:hypothetical protein
VHIFIIVSIYLDGFVINVELLAPCLVPNLCCLDIISIVSQDDQIQLLVLEGSNFPVNTRNQITWHNLGKHNP